MVKARTMWRRKIYYCVWRTSYQKNTLSTLGDMLDCSGWASVLTKATVTKSGTSDSHLKAVHITSTRKAHEIALFTFQKKAYESFESLLKVSFEIWQKDMASKNQMYQLWNLILHTEMKVLFL